MTTQEANLTQYLHNKAGALHIPLNGTFELTPLCNMQCKMCYVRLEKHQQEALHPLLTTEQWLKIAQQAKEQGLLYLLLTGGEPFLRPDFPILLRELHQMGLILTVNTNGTLIDEPTLAWLQKTPPTRLNVTLYGASDETYGRLCGNPQGFRQVTHALRLLRDAGFSVRLNCSVTPANCGDLEAIFAFARAEGFPIEATAYMFPPLRRDASQVGQNFRFSPEEAAYYTAKIESLRHDREAFLSADINDLPIGSDCMDGSKIRCQAGRASFWLTWDGRLMPCGMINPEDSPSVLEQGFAPAWEQVWRRSADIRLPAACNGCAAQHRCMACAAMVYTESGCFHQVPTYRCAMTSAYPAQLRKVQEELR